MKKRDLIITKEQLTEWVSQLDRDGDCDVTDHQLVALIRQSLVAMNSQPVAYIDKQWTLVYYVPPMSMGLKIGDKLYSHAQPAKSLELAGWQFKSVNGDWLGLINEHGKSQAVREGCEVREVFAIADGINDCDNVRREHAEWSQAMFGNVGPVGPLKHLSKEALEAAADPSDLSEWADIQFLMWDAQRRAGITDEQITQAMIEKLVVNKQRSWPEPKDGEPRLHVKKDGDCDATDQHLEVLIRRSLSESNSKPVLNVQFKNGWPVVGTVGIISGSPSISDGFHDFYTVQPPSSDLAFEQNFRDAMEGIGHIRRALEETFGGLHGTHCEPDILVDCKEIVDAIYAAYRSAGNADSTSPSVRVISIRHKDYSRPDDLETSARLWLDAAPQPADRQTSTLVMWVKRLSRSLRSVSPDNKLPKAAMGYLQNNGLISIADCLRGNNEEPPA